MPRLYHWDLPAALDDRGGWLNRDIADWFADYAAIVYKALDDTVEWWATLNEPWVVTDGGYLHGALPPRHRNLFETPIASHHLRPTAQPAAAPGRGGGGFRWEGQARHGQRGNQGAEVPGLQKGRSPRPTPPRRCVHEPPVSRSRLPRPVPRGDGGAVRRSVAEVPG